MMRRGWLTRKHGALKMSIVLPRRCCACREHANHANYSKLKKTATSQEQTGRFTPLSCPVMDIMWWYCSFFISPVKSLDATISTTNCSLFSPHKTVTMRTATDATSGNIRPPLSPHKAITAAAATDATSRNIFSFNIYTPQRPPPSPTCKRSFCMVDVSMHGQNGKRSKIVK